MPLRTPSYRHHKPSGQAVVTLGGKDHYLGNYGSRESREAYDRLLAEWLANHRRPTPREGERFARISVAELLDAYLEHARRYYVKDGEPTSEQDTIRQAQRPVRLLYANVQARDFGPLALKAVRQQMIDRGWCRTFINRQVNRIKRIWAWAAENELVPIETYQALAIVAGLRKGRSEAREKPPVRPVPDEAIAKVLPHLPATIATMVQVQRLAGMRPQEVILMSAADIDTSDPTCWVYRPRRHKGEHHGRDRQIFLGPRVQQLLRPYLEAASTGYLFSPRISEERRGQERRAQRKSPLTPSQRARRPRGDRRRPPGEMYDHGSYRKAIRRVCKRLGIPVWFPNQLRHSAATEIRRRFGLEASQAVLGHSELGTSQIYAEVDRTTAYRIMAEVG